MMKNFISVWAHNFEQELAAVDRCLCRFPIVSFDTEFQGYLRNTPRDASEGLRYQDLAFNVNSLKLIQLGVTLFNDRSNVGGTWEFNFRGFDEESDPHVPESVALLKVNGLDLEKFGKFGIDSEIFVEGFVEVLRVHRGRLLWVSFHGLYDSAYLIKLVIRRTMPSSPTEFSKLEGCLFERIYDLKFMAKYCPGLFGGEIGLERMSKILGVQRCGDAHQSGSDSLLTAEVFLKMRSQFGLKPGMYEGFLYSFSPKICGASSSLCSSVYTVHRAPPHPAVLVPAVPTRPVILIRHPSSRDPVMLYRHPPSPSFVFMHRPPCSPFPALPQALPQYDVHM